MIEPGLARTPTYSLSLKRMKRVLSNSHTVDETMPKKKRSTPTKSSAWTDLSIVSPSKKQTLITNFCISPNKSQESLKGFKNDKTPDKTNNQNQFYTTPIKSVGDKGRSLKISSQSESKENEIIVIHDSQSQSGNNSLLDSSKNSSDIIVIDDSQPTDTSFNKSDESLPIIEPANIDQTNLIKVSEPPNNCLNAINPNIALKVNPAEVSITPVKSVLSKEGNKIRLKKPHDLLSENALKMDINSFTTSDNLSLPLNKEKLIDSTKKRSTSPTVLNSDKIPKRSLVDTLKKKSGFIVIENSQSLNIAITEQNNNLTNEVSMIKKKVTEVLNPNLSTINVSPSVKITIAPKKNLSLKKKVKNDSSLKRSDFLPENSFQSTSNLVGTPKKPPKTKNAPSKKSSKQDEFLSPMKNLNNQFRTPKKSPNKMSPSQSSKKNVTPKKDKSVTPKKNNEMNFDGAKFSPKIRNRPGKYFNKGSIPEGLVKSPAKSESPKKTGTPRKRNLMAELNADSSQTKLDRFMGSGATSSEDLLDDDMDFLVEIGQNVWKATMNLMNNTEAMEKIRQENALKTTLPIEKPQNVSVVSNDYSDHVISYLLNNPMISCAIERGIFSNEDFGSMLKSFSELTPSSQRLYIKMFERTVTWYRVETDLVKRYSDKFGDVRGLVQTLIAKEFVTNDLSGEELLSLLKLLQLGEVKSVGRHFNIKVTEGSMSKDSYIKAILNHACSQRVLFGNLTKKIKDRVIKELGQCVKLRDTYNNMFNLLVIVATYPYYQDEEKKRLGDLVQKLNLLKSDNLTFPAYVFRPEVAFADLNHLSSYADSLSFVAEYSALVERKDWELAANKVIEAKAIFSVLLSQSETSELVSRLGGQLLKFTAGYQMCYCLSNGITVLKKHTHLTDECIEVITLLLSQNIYRQKKRGIWYDELALLHQTRKKDLVAACEVVLAGLNDPKVDIIQKKVLSQRGTTLLKRKSSVINGELKQQLADVVSKNSAFSPSVQIITAQSHEGSAGYKQVFVKKCEDGTEFTSVEEVVIDHFKNQATPSYKHGIHDEGRILMNVILACFYDVIYSHPEGSSMFHCQMQTRPLDWGGTHFYMRRRHSIQDLLDRLRLGGIHEIMSHIQEIVSQAEVVSCVVNWDYLRPEKLVKIKELLECLGVEIFLKIAEHVIKDYGTYHSGFPDLILWDPPSLRCLIVEVKGPNDKLSPSQTIWLENLTNFGATAIVCHVENLGSSKRRAK